MLDYWLVVKKKCPELNSGQVVHNGDDDRKASSDELTIQRFDIAHLQRSWTRLYTHWLANYHVELAC